MIISNVKVMSVVAIFQQIPRWWRIRELRKHWAADQLLLKIAKKRDWTLVLNTFSFESNYRMLRLCSHDLNREIAA
ncbi:hypothetical protein AB4870_002055 [Yersinia enterocolitica]|nr:hypothetical protein [Yersinia enterocolitica]EKN4829467.1 hypothetical protein [Yersinia enterocolitica]EKN4851455.1 hypothetical protein [Yersinia enterocolitica]ELW8175719.1 hypothetical protein [Yersinia enterocolitica]